MLAPGATAVTTTASGPPDLDLDPDSEDSTERSLELGLRRRPLSDEVHARVRAAVEAEWRAALPAARRWSRRRWAGLAAGVAAVTIIAAAWLRPEAEAAVVGTVVRVDAGGLESGSAPFLSRAVNVGGALHTAQKVTAHGSALVALQGGGTLRIARGTVIEALGVNEIRLRDGQIYVDLPLTLPRRSTFIVHTSLGSIEHVGTQFEVATVDHAIRIRVREGQIRLRRPSGAETAAAGTELLIRQAGPVARNAVTTHGRQWSWVEALAPEFEIENRQLVDFLQWAARETGRELEIADDHANQVAERTHLHGSVQGLTPLEALGRVLSTTSLRFELHGDMIRVSSGG
jgi:ferric-dicitrate binding protein FerR (iron transport regulator)